MCWVVVVSDDCRISLLVIKCCCLLAWKWTISMEFKSFLLYLGWACLNSMGRFTKSVQAQWNHKKNKLKKEKEGGKVEREKKRKRSWEKENKFNQSLTLWIAWEIFHTLLNLGCNFLILALCNPDKGLLAGLIFTHRWLFKICKCCVK